MVNFRPQALYLTGMNPFPIEQKKAGWAQSQSGYFGGGGGLLPPPGFEPWIIQPRAYYTNFASLAPFNMVQTYNKQ